MISKKYISVDNETQAIESLSELKRQGIDEDDMYVIHNKGEKIAILGTEVDVETIRAKDSEIEDQDDKSVWQKFTDFFTGDDRVESALDKSNLTDEEKKEVLAEVRNDKIVILIDKEYRGEYCEVCTEYKSSEDAKIDKMKTGYEPFIDPGTNNSF